jgi:hypothetical protein
LTLWISLGLAGPPNPMASDGNGNTAGGGGALLNVDGTLDLNNTAFGDFPLFTNTTASANTAVGSNSLSNSDSATNNGGRSKHPRGRRHG